MDSETAQTFPFAQSFEEIVLWHTPRSHLVFSIVVIFAKCACGPCGVKNSLFTKKHRNR